MRKIYELDPTFSTGESTIQPVVLWDRYGNPICENFSKTASDASDYIKSVTPQPGKTIVLVLALGAYETYDLNRNGDGFNEFAYKPGFKPSCGCCSTKDGWITQEESLTHHFKSFEEHGKVYKHHVNKDPTKSFGEIIKAFWNSYMHRVELLVGIDNVLAPDIVARITNGEYPAVSMGCRIKYDVCTICGHQAPTRAKYCDHLKFSLRQVHSSGIRAGALNPSPRFFDISFVIKPADQTGYMLKKVAYEIGETSRYSADLGNYIDIIDEKRAAIQKVSDIDKVIRGLPVDAKTTPLAKIELKNIQTYKDFVLPHVVGGMPDIDDGTLSRLAKHPVANVLSTLSSAGIILTTSEFIKLIVQKLSPQTVVPEHTLDAIVALQGQIFELLANNPQLMDQIMLTGLFDLDTQKVDPQINSIAEKYIEKRSTIGDYLSRSLISPTIRKEEPPFTDTLHVRDPSTGERYTTTRGAAIKAHDSIAKKQLMKTVGGAALLAGAYKVLAPGIPKSLRPVAAGTGILLGAKHLKPDFGSHYMTEEDIPISTLTELSPEKTSSNVNNIALPILGTVALVTALGHDYDSRLRRGMMLSPEAPIHSRLTERLGQYSSEHPALAFMGGLGLYGLARSKLSSYVGNICEPITDAVTLPDVNIDLLAMKLGTLLI